MLTRSLRVPITLQPPQRNNTSQRTGAQPLSLPQHESSRKKIVINRKIVPKITIRVDELIRDTFSNLASGKLKRVTDSSMVLNNSALLDYIRAIYETYDIEDPMIKYGKGVQEQPEHLSESKWALQPTIQPQADALASSKVQSLQRTAEHRYMPSGASGPGAAGSESRKSVVDRSVGERNTSKSKINRLKESIREGSTFQPIEVKTISLTTQKKQKSSASIKKRIMFGSPSPAKEDKEADNTLGQISTFQKDELSTSHIERLSQSQRRSYQPGLSTNHIEMSYEQQQTGEISPTFRYCFMCECSILQANMGVHEKVCRNFNELYNMDWQDIVRLLESKIIGVKQCISNVLNSAEEGNVEGRIRESVLRWMGEVKAAEENGLNFNHEYEAAYGHIERLYETQSFRLLELTYKLKWFLRIRERIKGKFGI